VVIASGKPGVSRSRDSHAPPGCVAGWLIAARPSGAAPRRAALATAAADQCGRWWVCHTAHPAPWSESRATSICARLDVIGKAYAIESASVCA
jgi:hypothetical protein